MSKKKKKFASRWSNQSKIGAWFGLSAVAVGKLLVEQGLKLGAEPTARALAEGYATSTPLANGTPFFMWSTEKVSALLAQTHSRVSQKQQQVSAVKSTFAEAQKAADRGDYKLASLMADAAYDDVPEHLRDSVRADIEEQSDGVASSSQKYGQILPYKPI